MYMDSPGFQVVTKGNKITVTVPDYRMNRKTEFQFDALTCYMRGKHPKVRPAHAWGIRSV